MGILALSAACGGAKVPAALRRTTLHIQPLTDLVAAAGLSWLVSVEPRSLGENAALLPALQKLASDAQLTAYAKDHGGLDLRSMQEVVVASYGEGTKLSLARGSLDPGALEKAFLTRIAQVEARHVEASSDDGVDTVLRIAGGYRKSTGVTPAELVLLGREAVVLCEGGSSRGRAAMLFARNMLKRAKPALQATPLDRISKLLGDAPVRVFAPGPFSDQAGTKAALGGLLSVTTAVGARVLVEERNHRAVLKLSAVLVGEWEREREAARERLSAAWNVLTASGTGRLLGLDRPVEPALVVAPPNAEGDALWVHAAYDAETLAKNATDLLEGDILRVLQGP